MISSPRPHLHTPAGEARADADSFSHRAATPGADSVARARRLPRLDTPHSDLSLVVGTLAGDRFSLTAIVARLQAIPRTLALCNARLGHPLHASEIEDLAQDVIGLVWSKLQDYAGLGSFDGWVYRFCVLRLKSYRRRRARFPVPLPDSDVRAAEEARERDFMLCEHVRRGLERLDAVTREIVRLKIGEDRTFGDVGAMLSLPCNTVKTRYYRGLLRLRIWLRSYGNGEPAHER